ncbi:hypothetical protein NL676_026086 [Syzygium grande]|nr:hypothetical protein NL676_026086 [Syzygium grande]
MNTGRENIRPPARVSSDRLELNPGKEAVRYPARDPSSRHPLPRPDALDAGLTGNVDDPLLDSNPRGVNPLPPGLTLDSELGLISPDLPVEANAGLNQAVVTGGKDILPSVKSSNTEHEVICPHQNFTLESNAELSPDIVLHPGSSFDRCPLLSGHQAIADNEASLITPISETDDNGTIARRLLMTLDLCQYEDRATRGALELAEDGDCVVTMRQQRGGDGEGERDVAERVWMPVGHPWLG